MGYNTHIFETLFLKGCKNSNFQVIKSGSLISKYVIDDKNYYFVNTDWAQTDNVFIEAFSFLG